MCRSMITMSMSWQWIHQYAQILTQILFCFCFHSPSTSQPDFDAAAYFNADLFLLATTALRRCIFYPHPPPHPTNLWYFARYKIRSSETAQSQTNEVLVKHAPSPPPFPLTLTDSIIRTADHLQFQQLHRGCMQLSDSACCASGHLCTVLATPQGLHAAQWFSMLSQWSPAVSATGQGLCSSVIQHAVLVITCSMVQHAALVITCSIVQHAAIVITCSVVQHAELVITCSLSHWTETVQLSGSASCASIHLLSGSVCCTSDHLQRLHAARWFSSLHYWSSAVSAVPQGLHAAQWFSMLS